MFPPLVIACIAIVLLLAVMLDGAIYRFACRRCLDEAPPYRRAVLITLIITVISSFVIYEIRSESGRMHWILAWQIYIAAAVIITAIVLRVSPTVALRVAATHLITWAGVIVVACGIVVLVGQLLHQNDPQPSTALSNATLTPPAGAHPELEAEAYSRPPHSEEPPRTARPWRLRDLLQQR